jgi:hypothetical protein
MCNDADCKQDSGEIKQTTLSLSLMYINMANVPFIASCTGAYGL